MVNSTISGRRIGFLAAFALVLAATTFVSQSEGVLFAADATAVAQSLPQTTLEAGPATQTLAKPSNRDPVDLALIENEVLAMVKAHLPEFEVLLDRLRQRQPEQYKRAVRSLARSARRLKAAKKRSPAMFELEVASVKANSNVNLLVAKLKVRESQADRDSLREAIATLHRATASRARYDVELLEMRLERAQKQLDAARERFSAKQSLDQEDVETQFANLLRKAGRQE